MTIPNKQLLLQVALNVSGMWHHYKSAKMMFGFVIHVYVVLVYFCVYSWTAYPSGAPEYTPGFYISGVRLAQCLVFCLVLCRSLFVPFFMTKQKCPLLCLPCFYLRPLITSLLSYFFLVLFFGLCVYLHVSLSQGFLLDLILLSLYNSTGIVNSRTVRSNGLSFLCQFVL